MAKAPNSAPKTGASLPLRDVATAKNSFTRNFLLPRFGVLREVGATQKAFEAQRTEIEARNAENRDLANKASEGLAGRTYVLIRQAADDGQMYGSVSGRDVADAIKAEGGKIERSMIVLDRPIKTLGLHQLKVRLHAEVAVTINLNIARSRQEAERQAREAAAIVPTNAAVEDEVTLQAALGVKAFSELSRIIIRSLRTETSLRLNLSYEAHRPRLVIEPAQTDALEQAMAQARQRGAARTTAILSSSDMLGADAFATLLGMTREAVRQKMKRREVLGLQGAKRGVRYPSWQVLADGRLLPALPDLFAALGDEPWTVFRFLTQPNPVTANAPPLAMLQAGGIEPVLAAAQSHGRGDFG